MLIDELKRLYEAATPGEWVWGDIEQQVTPGEAIITELVALGPPDTDGSQDVTCVAEIGDAVPIKPADAELLTCLRNAVPSILAMAEENERLRQAEALLALQNANLQARLAAYEPSVIITTTGSTTQ